MPTNINRPNAVQNSLYTCQPEKRQRSSPPSSPSGEQTAPSRPNKSIRIDRTPTVERLKKFLVNPNAEAVKAFRDNPSLQKETKNGYSRYIIGNHTILNSYPLKADTALKFPRKIGETQVTRVFSRKNQASPFYKKVQSRASDFTSSKNDIDRIRNNTNSIAALTAKNDLLQKYLRVELITEVSEENIIYVTPSVKGYTIESYLNNLKSESKNNEIYSEDISHLEEKIDELAPVIRELARHGYIHGDINTKNMMYDKDSKRVVLIDFEKSKDLNNMDHDKRQKVLKRELENLDYAKGALSIDYHAQAQAYVENSANFIANNDIENLTDYSDSGSSTGTIPEDAQGFTTFKFNTP